MRACEKFTTRAACCTMLTALMLTSAGNALAQVADPTRPPGVIPGSVSPTGAPGYEELPQGVQAVFIRPKGKSTALVHGQTVGLGDIVDGKKVVRIFERGVVLQGDTGKETLDFYPGVEKAVVKTRRSVAPDTNSSKEARK